METFRPYVWLRKQSSLFNEFFCITIPSGYRVSGGLQSPTDDVSTGIRTYQFTIESHLSSASAVIDSNVGDHSQPANISGIEFQVIDVTDSGKPVKKGQSDTSYQNGDGVS